ncbi:hypothetical protein ACFQH6_09690 [Halobacteriaceae archaeon GCM10025711]
MDRRGQAHTLEAFTAALIVLAGLVFALQATAVTPLSASTSNQHIENQEQAMAADVLATTDANGSLREAVLYWNTTSNQFNGSGERGSYSNGGPPNDFGNALDRTFADERIAYNVYVRHWRASNTSGQQAMVYMGTPSDNAVSASRTVVIYDDSQLSVPGETENVSTAAATGDFYARDAAPNGTVFNVVEVQIVVWRM